MTEPGILERFSAGEQFAVHPDAIERELSALWRAAGKSTDATHPVTRACLWNVVVHVEERSGFEGHHDPEAEVRVVNDLPRHLAARSLVLRTRAAEEGKDELESWISANCILAGDGGKLVCSEEITLASRGAGERHLAALVRALLVPAVPTASLFGSVPDPDSALVRGLVSAADRVVTRVASSRSPGAFARLLALSKRTALGAMDLGWVELGPFRRELAALLDPPFPAGGAGAIEQITVQAGPEDRAHALLLLGWLGGCLGSGAPQRHGAGEWTMVRSSGGRLGLQHVELPGVAPSVTLTGGLLRGPLKVAVNRQTSTFDIESLEGVIDKKPLSKTQGAALLAGALATRGQDRAFMRALATTAELT